MLLPGGALKFQKDLLKKTTHLTDEAVQLPRMREAVERTRNMEEPEAISAAALTEKPIS